MPFNARARRDQSGVRECLLVRLDSQREPSQADTRSLLSAGQLYSGVKFRLREAKAWMLYKDGIHSILTLGSVKVEPLGLRKGL